MTDGAEDTRRRVTRTELNNISPDKSIVQGVIDAFGKYRLLTFDYEPGTHTPTIEVAHEALIRVWSRLHDWLDMSREELRLHRRLSNATVEWAKAGRDASFLASGSRLVQFEPLGASPIIKLTPDESAYLWASIAARQSASIRIRNGIIALSIFALFALILAIFAFDRQRQAETQTERANSEATVSRSRELAVMALRSENRLDIGLLLSLESLNTSSTFEARNSLVTNLEAKPELTHFLTAHTDTIRTLVYSPDGKILASAGKDLSVILWDTQTNQPIGKPLQGHTNWINALAFSPDSKTLLSVSIDGTVRRWDDSTGQPIGEPLNPNSTELWSIAFNPDGKTFSTGDKDGTILLWDAATGKTIGSPLTGHTDLIYALAYSPDGKALASGGTDKRVKVWNPATGRPIATFEGHEHSVWCVAFSPDGNTVASGSVDKTIKLWDVTPKK
jgi:WD40 repeat protein